MHYVHLPEVVRHDADAVAALLAAAEADRQRFRKIRGAMYGALIRTGRLAFRGELSPKEIARRKKARKAARASRKANR